MNVSIDALNAFGKRLRVRIQVYENEPKKYLGTDFSQADRRPFEPFNG